MNWYDAAGEPEPAEFGPVSGLSVSGQGAPGGAAYGASVGALYAVMGALGAPMAPLEGRWWVEDERSPFDVPRDEWRWHLFIRLPDGTGGLSGTVDAVIEEVRAGVPAAARVQQVTFTVGRCVQMLHRGAYSDEPASLARMDALMTAEGLVRNGLHHEIYLSDPSETDPEKMRTILRQPVRRAAAPAA
ncbi:GyrI-like domain-containing protein [Actinomadura graeca]|uniref:GyrI-like domain-containing protein n=1 Tax=Actinomadura graeca TaxID=2750812 RepID=A0ABX8QWI6_9ACTN|nr:GyrI-like domain-containing protein [Actinomadura graeca]QXJ23189.1 GyrI-like domain-containing protein [Actinomadura graeca]